MFQWLSVWFLVVLLSVGCTNGTIPETPNVTFNQNIKPITSMVCIKCHNTPGRNWSDYKDAYNKRTEIYQKVVIERVMPFGEFMSEKDRALFRDWYKQGSKE